MSNRFDFLKPQSSGSDEGGDRASTDAKPTPTQSVSIPGLEPRQDEKVVLERLNVEIPAELHQQLKEYCTRNQRTKKEVITALIEFLLSNQE